MYSVGDDGQLVFVNNVVDAGALELDGVGALTTAVINGTTFLFAGSREDDGVSVFSIGNDGSLTNVENVSDNGVFQLDDVRSVTTAVLDGITFLFVAGREDNGVSVFSVANDGSLVSMDHVTDTAGLDGPPLAGVSTVTTAVINGITYLFAGGSSDSGVGVFSVANDGTLTNVDNVRDFLGGPLELSGISSLITAEAGGTTFLFAAGEFDAGISVFIVNDNGTLANVDNVMDDATLELDGVISLSTSVVDGTIFLFAAGRADSGVSIFSVGNDGTLTNVDNVADAGSLQLGGAESITTSDINGSTFVFTTAGLDDGVSVFEFDAGFGGTVTFTEGGTAVQLQADADISDLELDAVNGGNGDYDGASITVARNGGANTEDVFAFSGLVNVTDAGGTLTVGGNAIATVTNTGGTLTINFTSANGSIPTSALVDEIVQAITYSNSSLNPPANVQVDFTIDDGSGEANAVATGSVNVETTVVDNPTPMIAGLASDITYEETDGTTVGAPQEIAAGLILSDGNDTNLESATITISSGFDAANDTLNFDTTGTNIVGVFVNGVLTLTGTDTIANYEAVLRSITYQHRFTTESTTDRVIDIVVADEETTSAPQSITVAINVMQNLTGTNEFEVLAGGFGNDIINGLGSDDVLIGGLGNDILDGGEGGEVFGDTASYTSATTLVIANLATGVASGADIGVDTLINIESLTGGSAGDLLIGNEEVNLIFGNSGGDQIDGGAGADTLFGGDGNDIYTVDNVGDVVVENNPNTLTGGIDTVNSTVDFTLSNSVEQLVLMGTAANGTGNGGNNVITAIAGSVAVTLNGGDGFDSLTSSQTGGSTLNGGSDGDTLIAFGGNNNLQGGTGDDTYFSFGANDTISEAGGDGIDTVFTSTDIVVGEDIEQVIVNVGATSATSNSLDDNNNFFGNFAGPGVAVTLDGGGGNDLLFGGDADDMLFGGEGIDLLFGFEGANTLDGGNGNDAYFSASATDTIVETASGGFDTQFTSVAGSTTIADNVEQLILLGDATTGIGNNEGNLLIGNSSPNGVTLNGMGGDDLFLDSAQDDTIIGGGGLDQINLQTGGNDTLVYEGAGFGTDFVFNFDADATGGQDTLDVSALGLTAGDIGGAIQISNSGGSALIEIGADSILLIGVDAGTIDATDFVLA